MRTILFPLSQSRLALLSLFMILAVLPTWAESSADVNGDGEVTVTDINYVIDIILGFDGDYNVADVNGDGEVTLTDVNVIINIILGYQSQLVDEHEYVDLGLPSGTLWATCNVGASSPEGYGYYFAWGETTPKVYYGLSNYKWYNASDEVYTKYCTESDLGIVDNKTELEPGDDAAHVNWGTSWCMPTTEQQQELCEKCSWRWISRNSVRGALVTGPNGNTIFLPASGYYLEDSLFCGPNEEIYCVGAYWSRTLGFTSSGWARYLGFYGTYRDWDWGYPRNAGFPVRAVRVSLN